MLTKIHLIRKIDKVEVERKNENKEWLLSRLAELVIT